jgi:hypothetical protein
MMKSSTRILIIVIATGCLTCNPATAQTNQQAVQQSMEQSNAMLNKFFTKCERRTRKAEKRFARYERKMVKTATGSKIVTSDKLQVTGDTATYHTSHVTNPPSLGKEPLLDSMRLAEGFRQYTTNPVTRHPSPVTISIDRAQQQLDITQRTKDELMQRKEYWKVQVKEHPEYSKWLSKMEKERYYYMAQISMYRSVLHDPSVLDDQLMSCLRSDPRFSDFMATLPAKPQDPAKMQPRQLVQQMMQSQAAAIDEDPSALIKGAKEKGSELLGDLSDKATEIGNIDNTAQVPEFKPDPFKTKSFWEHFDVGFDLQFDRNTFHLPSSGVAGLQLAFNFNERFSAGALVNYRFGMGEIKHIRFSHQGAGYGVFINSKIWKNLGAQAGYERNWRTDTQVSETVQFDAGWTTAMLAGLTYEYSIGKKVKATLGVFCDFLYKKYTPQSNAVLWRMGWKF